MGVAVGKAVGEGLGDGEGVARAGVSVLVGVGLDC